MNFGEDPHVLVWGDEFPVTPIFAFDKLNLIIKCTVGTTGIKASLTESYKSTE